MATNAAHLASLARTAISTPSPKARAQCSRPARWDLCGGRAEPMTQGPSLPQQADFCPTSYGFRPGRRAQDAVEEVRFFINAPRCYEWVIEGDVEDCLVPSSHCHRVHGR